MRLFSKWKQRIAEKREDKEINIMFTDLDNYEITDEGRRLIDYLSDSEAGTGYIIQDFESIIEDLQNQTGHSREQVIGILRVILMSFSS